MKKMILIFTVIFALLLTSCTATIKKGNALIDDEKYDKAIEVFNKIIDKDETNYDAWFGIVEAQMEDDEYEDAEDTLKDMYDVLDENYDEDSDVDYESIFEDFQDYIADIIDEEGSIGNWYSKLQPTYVDISQFDYMTYEAGSTIELEVPKDVDLYYNLDGDEVTIKDEKYKDKIQFDEEGDFTLTVAAANKFGVVGPSSYAYITIAKMPDMPTVDTSSGTYASPLTVFFGSFDQDNLSLYYTLDGTDPTTNGYSYYAGDGLRIPSGDIQLRAVLYDYYSNLYSPELTVNYTVEAAQAPLPSMPAGSYSAPFNLQFSGYDSSSASVYYTIDGYDPVDYGYYFDPYYGIDLEPGTYEVVAVIYDYNTSEYSEQFRGTYTIN